MLALLGILAERRAVNSGWLSTPTLVFAGIALLLAPRFLGALAFYALVIAVVIVLGWRLAPNYFDPEYPARGGATLGISEQGGDAPL